MGEKILWKQLWLLHNNNIWMPRFKCRYLWFYLLLWEAKVMLSWVVSYRLCYLLFYERVRLSCCPGVQVGREGAHGFHLLSYSFTLLLWDSIWSWRLTFCAVNPLLSNAFLRLKDIFFSGSVFLCAWHLAYNFCFRNTLQYTIVQPVAHLLKHLLFYRVSPSSL